MDFSANNRYRLPRIFSYGILCLIVASCHTTPDAAKPATDKLLQAYEALHQRLEALIEQDNAYAGLLSEQVTTAQLDESSGTIIQAEMALQRTIDSLDKLALADGNDQKEALRRITAHFKALLQSRRLLSDMRMALSAGSDDSTTAQRMLMQLRTALRAKDEKIAALEKAAQAANSSTAPPETKMTATNRRNAVAGSENIEQLKQRNNDLQQSLQAMETKYFTIGRNYLLLKKEHERTMNELAALRRSNGQ